MFVQQLSNYNNLSYEIADRIPLSGSEVSYDIPAGTIAIEFKAVGADITMRTVSADADKVWTIGSGESVGIDAILKRTPTVYFEAAAGYVQIRLIKQVS